MPSFGSSVLVFYVNGKKIEDEHVDPAWTLLEFLRTKLRLCGTKLGCGEGGCGACTVMVSKFNRNKKTVEHFTVNACLAPVASMHGLAVTTVEGIGSTRTRLHPVQERIAKAHGTQCGFCTPGIVMSMYTLLRRTPQPTMEQIEEYLQGNLCRCTGYRPILQGFNTFTSGGGGCCGGQGATSNGCCKNKDNNLLLDDDMATSLFDQKEFEQYDPTQEIIFPPSLKTCDDYDQQSLVFQGSNVTWFRPKSLTELLDLKEKHPDAKMSVGNTEIGIEVKFKNCKYPVLISPTSVAELSSVTSDERGVTVGAALALTSVESELRQIVDTQPEHKTRTLVAICEMLHWFSGTQIRNVACIGGNIVTASPIADLNPLLMAAGAELLLQSKGGRRTVVMDGSFFPEYRKTLLNANEVIVSVRIPYTVQDEYLFGFKQSQRREDDIAIVNAGMRVLFEPKSNSVKEMRLAFGGMAATTVMATKTMNALKGKRWEDQLVSQASQLLPEDLPLDASAPGGMIAYRQALTTSFFFKFYLKVLQELNMKAEGLSMSKVPESYKSVCAPFHKDAPKASQMYQIVVPGQLSDDPVGRPLPHQSAFVHATGEAVYTDDMAPVAGELHLAFVISTHAHAKIVSIDASQALALTAVHAFFSAEDLPDANNATGLFLKDEVIFADGKVTCQGQIIGAVVAEDRNTAQKAAKLVRVEYEDLQPLILTIEDAIAADSFYHDSRQCVSGGNVDQALANSDHVLEGQMRMGGQEHFYLETHCSRAVPKGEHDEIEIFISTQSPNDVQRVISQVLGVPAHKVIIRVKRLGGGFGGKEIRAGYYGAAVALAAKKLNRPVRFMFDRDEDMVVTGGRHPFLCQYKVGFSKTGKILGLKAALYNNGGHVLDLSAAVMCKAVQKMGNAYLLTDFDLTGNICRTNVPTNVAFRAFGGPQGVLFMENIMNNVAVHLNLEPCRVRELNLIKEGDRALSKQVLKNVTVGRCWEECIRLSNYWHRRQDVDQFNRENRWKKRGICVVPIKFGIGFGVHHYQQGGALINVYTDGTVLVTHGGVEMGQGLHTKLIQVASRVLGIPVSKIHISEVSTDKVPNSSVTAGSMSSDLNGMAVLNGCQILRERLEPYMYANPKGTWEDWVKAAYMDRVSLSTTGFYKIPTDPNDRDDVGGEPQVYFVYGAGCTEVEIDCLTGDHQVIRTDIVMDLGESLNPAVDIGQIEGAFMQGYGLYTLEELRYSPSGFLYTRGPGTYKIPGFGDIPSEFYVSLLKGSTELRAVYSSKAVGEPPLLLATSVFYAIKDAILSARIDAGLTGLFELNSPATSERIRMACVDQFTKQVKCNESSGKPWSIVV